MGIQTNKLTILFFVSMILLSSLVSAELLQVKSVAINDALVREMNMSAKFNITVTNNNDYMKTFEIDTFLDMEITPHESMSIPAKSSLEIPIEVTPSASLKERYQGVTPLSYYVSGITEGIRDAPVNNVLPMKIVSLRDALDIKIPATVRLSDGNLTISIENKENMFVSGNLKVSADMLSGSTDVTLEPNSKKYIDVPISTVRQKAGKYLITIDLETPDYTLEQKEEIILEPSAELRTDESRTGSIFAYTSKAKKTNIGNIETNATIRISKTTVSDWFTTFSQVPEQTERKGLIFTYSWSKMLNLDESFEISARTDYSLPLTILFVLAVSLIFVAIYMQKQIIVRKRTHRVKTSTGGFALKIQLNVKCVIGEAREVTITDFIPAFAQFYEKSATLPPDRKIGRALTWYLGNMIKGEEKTFTYVIYSPVKVVGKIDLPVVKGTYRSKKNRLKHMNSNSIFVLAEEAQKE